MSTVTIEMLGDRQRRIRRLQTIARMMDTASPFPERISGSVPTPFLVSFPE
jgi:hypothetical protein